MELEEYIIIFITSMFKFILGPVSGVTTGLSLFETVIFTVAGMMTTVVLLTFLGNNARKAIFSRLGARRKLFTPRNRRIVKIWRKYGVVGIAFLTPLLFSPPVGTLIVVSFGESWQRIFSFMLASAIFWGVCLTLAGEQLFELLRSIGLLQY